MSDTMTLIKTKTRVKVGVISAGIMMAAAAGAAGGANYMIGRGLVLNNDFFQVPDSVTAGTADAKLLSVNMSFSDGPFFLAAEPVNLSQIKVAFIGNGLSGDALQKMVRNLTLYYHRVSGSGYNYGYGADDAGTRYLGLAPQVEKVGSENIVTATFALPQSPAVRIQPGNVYNFELHGAIPADAPAGQFAVLIDDVAGWGVQSGKAVRVVNNNSRGKVMSVAAAPQPKITIHSPNGGELYKIGDTVRIRWQAQGVDRVGIYVSDNRISSSGSTNYVSFPSQDSLNVPAAQGYYDWKINSSIPSGQGNNYKISISARTNSNISDQSDAPFIIMAAASAQATLGDVNGDGKVDSGDATLVNQYVQGARTLTSTQLTAADVNKDGRVTANDAKIILQYSVGKYGSLPVSVKIGDVNKDGKVDSGDSISVTQYLAGKRTFDSVQDAAADVNNDNQITQADANIILSYSVGNIATLPVAYGTTTAIPTPAISTRPNATTTPFITVSSSSGGEQWEQGKTYKVRWQSNGVMTANMTLESGSRSLTSSGLIGNSSNGSGNADFKVPADFPLGDAKLYVRDNNNNNVFGTVAVRIAAPPSITVLSPNGGEKLEIGKQYTIRWRANGVGSVNINLVNYSPALASQYNLASNVPAGQGSYTWTAQNARSDSNYKIVVVGGSVSDASDSSFSIAAPVASGGQNKYTFSQQQYGWYQPRCACDKNAQKRDCSTAGFATADPAGSVCYDWNMAFYNRYGADKYVVAGPVAKVSVDQSGLPETIIKGAAGVTLAKYVFDARESSEDIAVKNVILQLTQKNAKAQDLQNCILYDGGVSVSIVSNPSIGPESGVSSGQSLYGFTANMSESRPMFTVPKGVTKTILLKCDVSGTAIQNGTFAWGIGTNYAADPVKAVGTTSNGKAIVAILSSTGKEFKIISGGSYSVSLDSSTPPSRLMISNARNVTMTVLKFSAKDEAIAVNKIRLGLTNLNSNGNDLSQIYIYDVATLLGQGVLGTGNAQGGTAQAQTTFTLSPPLQIPANSSKIVTIKADIAPITTVNSIAKAGDAIAINFIGSADSTKNSGVGQGSGRQITTDSSTTQQAPTYIFRSVPTVSAVPLPTTNLSNGTRALYKFKVAADTHGDIDLYKMTFDISANGATVKDVTLVDVTDSSEIALSSNGDNDIIISPARTVAAGTSRIFELRGTVTGVNAGAYVSTKLSGDANGVAAVSVNSVRSNAENDFIWSDWSSTNHTGSGGGNDWHNGYLVNGLPASGLGPQTLSR